MSSTNTTPEGADVAATSNPANNPADGHVIAREDAAFARAAEADRRVQGGLHFMDWLAISEGLGRLRDRAMRESYSNRPYGKAYTQRYAALKETHPWAKNYDPATASHACWLYDNQTDVLRWREGLAKNQRDAWITPRIVHQHYDRLTKVSGQKAATASSTSRENNAQQIIRLQEEVDMLRKRGGGGLMPGASVEQLVEEIAVAHNPRFIRRLVTALTKRLESEERQDAIEGKAAKRKPATKAKAAAVKPPATVAYDDMRASPGILIDESGRVIFDGEAKRLGVPPFRNLAKIEAHQAKLQAMILERRAEREAEAAAAADELRKNARD